MQSKAFVVLVAAFMALPTALAVPAQCKPEPTPTPTPPPNPTLIPTLTPDRTIKPRNLTCDGHLYCCSKGLQGKIGYYCGSGPITKEDACDMVTVCCAKGAGREPTPRGYTYRGCSMPGTSS